MIPRIAISVATLTVLFFAGTATADEATAVEPQQPAEQDDTVLGNTDEQDIKQGEAQTPAEPTPETSLDACRDELDNDADGLEDCSDPDCQIYAACVKPVGAAVEQAPVAAEPPKPIARPERGKQCTDGLDNNGDGLIDCHEHSCQGYRYCYKQMYVIPESPDKAPGLLVGMGIGFAAPNFRFPSAVATSDKHGEVPFDPDMGVAASLQLAYMPTQFIGAGIQLSTYGTFASNRLEFVESADKDTDYKYIGDKESTHMGAFVRLQYLLGRFVPFVDISGSYGYVRYNWEVYEPENRWADVEAWYRDDSADRSDQVGSYEVHRQTYRHFTLAVEPGFDVFVIERVLAVGMRAHLPVYASEDPSTDNVAILTTMTWTPFWRGRPELKREYDALPD